MSQEKNPAHCTLDIQRNGQDTCTWNVVQFLGEFPALASGLRKKKTKQTQVHENLSVQN